MYGPGMRLHNCGRKNGWRCTVCKNTVKDAETAKPTK